MLHLRQGHQYDVRSAMSAGRRNVTNWFVNKIKLYLFLRREKIRLSNDYYHE